MCRHPTLDTIVLPRKCIQFLQKRTFNMRGCQWSRGQQWGKGWKGSLKQLSGNNFFFNFPNILLFLMYSMVAQLYLHVYILLKYQLRAFLWYDKMLLHSYPFTTYYLYERKKIHIDFSVTDQFNQITWEVLLETVKLLW